MSKPLDLNGEKINDIEILKRVEERKHKKIQWLAKCHCGKEFLLVGSKFKSGVIKSCGCLRHGESNTRLYRVWAAMKNRCSDSNNPAYKNYGGRGIEVCEAWRDSYVNFKSWAESNGYEEYLTLDRRDVNGNYEPENCRWADEKTQGRNRRVNKKNKSGFTGIYWKKTHKVWYTTIYIDGKEKYLGGFKDLSEAVKVRWQAELNYWGFTNITEEQLKQQDILRI